MRVDILMCTFRRPMVGEAIRALAGLRGVGDLSLRLVVADNDDTDSARELVQEAARSLPFPCHYIHAPARNISVARNACLDAASEGGAQWIASIDDDEIASPVWLAELLGPARDADCVIGTVLADYPKGTPAWVRELDYHSCVPDPRAPLIANSGNVALRWKDTPWQDQRYDIRRGTTGGEDTEFFVRLGRMGLRTVAAPKAVVSEPVPPARQTLEWLGVRRFRMGQTHAVTAGTPLRKLRLLVSALAKAGYCRVQERRHSGDQTQRNFWFLRGQLHRGVVAQLTSRRPQPQLYGRDPV